MEILQSEITECQDKIKEIKENIQLIQSEAFNQENEINDKIEEELKILKIYRSQNDILMAEYNATKKDLEIVVHETEEKLKKEEEKLELSIVSLTSMTKEFKKKRSYIKI